MKKFKDLRERFSQSIPKNKRLVDFELFLDGKDIDKALKILTTLLKKAKLTFNKKMKNVKHGQMGTEDVMINAIDEGDRHRLIVLKNVPDMKNRKEVDLSSAFMAIQKLPSAQFKGMYAEGWKAFVEGRGPKMKDIKKNFAKEIRAFQSGKKDLDWKAENALLSWALLNNEIKTDDPDELDDWLEKNVMDVKAFGKLK